jgi:hypothetical protein
LESTGGNINISAKESLGYYELKSTRYGSKRVPQSYQIKANNPNCSRYRIQAINGVNLTM